LAQTLVLYDPQQHNPRVLRTPLDQGVGCLTYLAWALWFLGYPEQAVQKEHETFALAEQLSHPHSLAWALNLAAKVRLWRREGPTVQAQAEAMLRLANERDFPYWLAEGTMLRGWALAEQGQEEEGIRQMRQGLIAWRALGSGVAASYFLSLSIDTYGRVGRLEEGFETLAEAFAIVHKTGEHFYEAELYRLKGELVFQPGVRGPESEEVNQKSKGKRRKAKIPSTQEAEACFLKAIDIARRQQAKSLELRAVTSLARLWQRQGREKEAHQMLSEIYNWFTEGFDTEDLQEAKALLDEL
jgi:adenylate cyclase